MKLSSLALCLVGSLPVIWTALPAQVGEPSPAQELEDSMHAAEEALEALAAAIDAHGKAVDAAAQLEQLAAAQQAVDSFQAAMLQSYGLTPRVPRTIEVEAEKLAFGIKFQRKILSTLDSALALELALVGGDMAGVKTQAAALFEAEQSGHREFRPKRERRGAGGPPSDGGPGGQGDGN
jgi:hypothetical protein